MKKSVWISGIIGMAIGALITAVLATIVLVIMGGSILTGAEQALQDEVPTEEAKPDHPLDLQFEGNLDFSVSYMEISKSISTAEAAWWEDMNVQMETLFSLQPDQQHRDALLNAQRKWEAALRADREFFALSSDDTESTLGEEGKKSIHMTFMQRVRQRTLDLTLWVE